MQEGEEHRTAETPPASAPAEASACRQPLLRVRYGQFLERGVFSCAIPSLAPGDDCIIKSHRGLEWGRITEINVPPGVEPPEGRVLRRPTASDVERIRRVESEGSEKEFRFCRRKIAEHGLPMKLVSVEKLFSGEKIIFYFTALNRVDFRALVKTLAQELKTRIELKQIGVRDEAKLLGSLGQCGRELCCRAFLPNIEQVTMKMAKMQKSTLDPTKISGRCGRLMCCLRFEDETYRCMKAQLPSKGKKMWTQKGRVEILDHQILSQKLFVRGEEGDRFLVFLSDLHDEPPPAPDPIVKQSEGGRKERSRKPVTAAPSAVGDNAAMNENKGRENHRRSARDRRNRGPAAPQQQGGQAADKGRAPSETAQQGPPGEKEPQAARPRRRRRNRGRRAPPT